MDFLLFDPGFVLGNITGFCTGGVVVAGLIHTGWKAAHSRIKAETELLKARAAAARQAEGWARAGAANDAVGHTRTARAEMRGGQR